MLAVLKTVGALLGRFKVRLRPGVAGALAIHACQRHARTWLREKTMR